MIHSEALTLLASDHAPAEVFHLLLTAQEIAAHHLRSDPLLALNFHCLAVYFALNGDMDCAVRELRRAAYVELQCDAGRSEELKDVSRLASLVETRLKLCTCLAKLGDEQSLVIQNAHLALRLLDAEFRDGRGRRSEAQMAPYVAVALDFIEAAQVLLRNDVAAFEARQLGIGIGQGGSVAQLSAFLQSMDHGRPTARVDVDLKDAAEHHNLLLMAASQQRSEAMRTAHKAVAALESSLEKRTSTVVASMRQMVRSASRKDIRSRARALKR